MPQSFLPVPESAGPIAGAPGHFAHHDWLTAAVKALDQVLGQRSITLQLGPSIAQTIAAGSYVKLRLDTVLAKSPSCPAYTLTSNTDLVLGDSWPTGIYRVDYSSAFVAAAGGTYAQGTRTARFMLNGATPASAGQAIYMAGSQSGRPPSGGSFGFVFLKPLDVLTLEGRQDSAGNLDTQPSSCALALSFATPAPALVNA